MRGIYIPGMDMPLACAPCPIKYWCGLWSKVTLPAHIRHPDCPLVEVPEHWRLVDVSALDVIHYTGTEGRPDTFDAGVKWLAEQIDKLPTVIPEDEA